MTLFISGVLAGLAIVALAALTVGALMIPPTTDLDGPPGPDLR